jgi:hypothetical protein
LAEVFAGFVMGYAISLAVAPAAAVALVRSNDRTGFAQRVAPPGTSVVALSVVIHFAALLVFTAMGMVFGMALAGVEDRRPEGGLGSPNVAYTLIAVTGVAVLSIPLLAIRPLRRAAGASAIALAALFGWALPWLAQAS